MKEENVKTNNIMIIIISQDKYILILSIILIFLPQFIIIFVLEKIIIWIRKNNNMNWEHVKNKIITKSNRYLKSNKNDYEKND